MNIRFRITMGFLLIVFIMAIVAGIIIWQQAKMQTAFENSCLQVNVTDLCLSVEDKKKITYLDKIWKP